MSIDDRWSCAESVEADPPVARARRPGPRRGARLRAVGGRGRPGGGARYGDRGGGEDRRGGDGGQRIPRARRRRPRVQGHGQRRERRVVRGRRERGGEGGAPARGRIALRVVVEPRRIGAGRRRGARCGAEGERGGVLRPGLAVPPPSRRPGVPERIRVPACGHPRGRRRAAHPIPRSIRPPGRSHRATPVAARCAAPARWRVRRAAYSVIRRACRRPSRRPARRSIRCCAAGSTSRRPMSRRSTPQGSGTAGR